MNIKSILTSPFIYNLFMKVGGGDRARRIYVDQYIDPPRGSRVLDIGCGPGYMCQYFSNVEYFGCDPDEKYICSAKEKYSSQGQFFRANLLHDDIEGEYDIIHLTGVLHHIDNQTASIILNKAEKALRPNGKLWTLDGCHYGKQNAIEKWVLDNDRGNYVREQREYESILKTHFPHIKAHFFTDLFKPIPHPTLILECSKEQS